MPNDQNKIILEGESVPAGEVKIARPGGQKEPGNNLPPQVGEIPVREMMNPGVMVPPPPRISDKVKADYEASRQPPTAVASHTVEEPKTKDPPLLETPAEEKPKGVASHTVDEPKTPEEPAVAVDKRANDENLIKTLGLKRPNPEMDKPVPPANPVKPARPTRGPTILNSPPPPPPTHVDPAPEYPAPAPAAEKGEKGMHKMFILLFSLALVAILGFAWTVAKERKRQQQKKNTIDVVNVEEKPTITAKESLLPCPVCPKAKPCPKGKVCPACKCAPVIKAALQSAEKDCIKRIKAGDQALGNLEKELQKCQSQVKAAKKATPKANKRLRPKLAKKVAKRRRAKNQDVLRLHYKIVDKYGNVEEGFIKAPQ